MRTNPINQVAIARDNRRFERIFRSVYLMWVIVAFFSMILSSYGTFANHPDYLRDWHAPLIILLAALVLSIYCGGLFSHVVFPCSGNWPPPFLRALIFWCSIYLLISVLSFLDANFTYAYFIALGLGFALFRPRYLIFSAIVIYLSFCAFQGDFTPPFTQGTLASMLGIGISFLSLTLICLWVQSLIGERYVRNELLAQLTQANTELEEAHHRLAESAAQEQELAVLRERTRLAREMHDTLGHALVLISIKLEAAQRLRERDSERCDRELESTKEVVRSTMNELRASIANLRSPTLEREPARDALSRYAHEMAARAGLHVEYDLLSDTEELPAQIEETLWKVGQEALVNIEKHAQARNVQLHIAHQDSIVTLRIADDGVGLPPGLIEQGVSISASPQGHYGLSGMVERVKHAGGHIAIYPGKAGGTVIDVELPITTATQ